MKKFALIGAAGYIAPRHFKAIKDTKNILIAACDVSDSVGILDSYFPECEFFTESARFERYLWKHKVDYLVVCTPNWIHDTHVKMGFNAEADVICEKPLVVNTWNIDQLEKAEEKSGRKVFTIQQLRKHPALKEVKQTSNLDKRGFNEIKVIWHTPRGKWYDISWKGNEQKSGGLLYNIGVHLFDSLLYLYGNHYKTTVIKNESRHAKGTTWFNKSQVHWDIGVNGEMKKQFEIGDKVIEIKGFEDLHTLCYRDILDGRGCTIKDIRPTIECLSKIRSELSNE